MQKLFIILFCLVFQSLLTGIKGSDNIGFKGQASVWMNVNPGNELPLWAGGRYIPQLNYGMTAGDGRLVDFEFSSSINGSGGMNPFDRFDSEGTIKPYRVWARYSGNQFELRMGLQKINFGSASMLRPLMWFDQVDPRDPLQLTDGVWGVLGRYYFLNNVNIWLWGLYGNEGPKAWEIGETAERTPEFGGRLQVPVPLGEAALSFHHRKAGLDGPLPGFTEEELPALASMPENRLGLDAKWDVEIGLWIEAAWIQKRKNIMQLTNQHLFTLGADYTFGIGNGLHLAAEHILISMDTNPFELYNRNHFTAASLSYPLGIFDNITAIVYRDWTNGNSYNFINWHRQLDRLSLYLMAFRNPETFRLPQQSETTLLFSGTGLQVMLVFNH